MASNVYSKYQKAQVVTASKEKILLMLYEGAIRFVKQARVAMQNKSISQKGTYISKCTAILSELMATLDHNNAKEIAADLERLYVFMIDKLIEANMNNDESALISVENILNTLYVAWKDVVENPREDGVPSKTLQPEEYKKYQDNQQKLQETEEISTVSNKKVTTKYQENTVNTVNNTNNNVSNTDSKTFKVST